MQVSYTHNNSTQFNDIFLQFDHKYDERDESRKKRAFEETDTHVRDARKEEQDLKLKNAFGISENWKSGDAFDEDATKSRRDKEKEERSARNEEKRRLREEEQEERRARDARKKEERAAEKEQNVARTSTRGRSNSSVSIHSHHSLHSNHSSPSSDHR